ncbi:ASKHA domain-containing protein [Lachnospiraceae bacterium 47-T17]
MDKVRITIEGKEGTQELFAEAGKRLTDVFAEAGIYLSAPCGGVGKCGKCKIRVLAGELPVTRQDERFFDADELSEGLRLACMARAAQDVTVRLTASDEEQFDALGAEGMRGTADAHAPLGIAIDIGTTTLAAALIDFRTGDTVADATAINHQRAYGADVISRIQAAGEGKAGLLQKCIREDLNALIDRLLKAGGAGPEQVERVAISGNTTMGHLLMGYPCEGLGVYPFTPYRLETVRERAAVILGEETCLRDACVTLLPGISAYVGADIAAGLLACRMHEKEQPVFLLDLGTNGEMAVGSRERILVTSTAAGPAFEGGNISCGTGSIPGAICNVSIREGAAHVATIGDVPARGLCGTGVIETTRELLANGLLDESGLLDEDYEEEGFPLAVTPEGETLSFTQRDVREIQLAKSAVRAGLETLLLRVGISCDEVAAVYVAGGFGFHLDIGKAVDIGLIPEALRDKVKAVGNSSLRGACDYLTRSAAPEQLTQIIAASSELALSMDKDFNELYVEHMMFETERDG